MKRQSNRAVWYDIFRAGSIFPSAPENKKFNPSSYPGRETKMSSDISIWLNSLQNFCILFGIGLVLTAVYLVIYVFLTAHNEFRLIRRNNISASIALGLSLIGFSMPLASSFVHSATVPECFGWGFVAMFIQIVVYWMVRIVIPNLSQRIAANELASALFLGAASIAAGLVNASAMAISTS